jgi:hypothetical protein
MKKLILLSLFLTLSTCLFSQDIIITKENERIEANVITVYDALVKYALYSNQDSTVLMPLVNVKSITYKSGFVENFEYLSHDAVRTVNQSNTKTNNEKVFKNVIRLKPFATIQGLIFGIFELDFLYARYLTPNVAIPLEVSFMSIPDFGGGFVFLTGIEAVPMTHRQKSGLFLSALVGPIIFPSEVYGVIVNPNIGYQLVTKAGFVFNVAIGPMYSSITNKVIARFSLDFGFAF